MRLFDRPFLPSDSIREDDLDSSRFEGMIFRSILSSTDGNDSHTVRVGELCSKPGAKDQLVLPFASEKSLLGYFLEQRLELSEFHFNLSHFVLNPQVSGSLLLIPLLEDKGLAKVTRFSYELEKPRAVSPVLEATGWLRKHLEDSTRRKAEWKRLEDIRKSKGSVLYEKILRGEADPISDRERELAQELRDKQAERKRKAEAKGIFGKRS